MSAFTMDSVARAICTASSYTFGGGIGEGTFKETYLAAKSTGEQLAVKILRPGCSTDRSEREVDAMKRCAHPNIIALLELAEFEHEGKKYVYLVEAFMGGGTLGVCPRNIAV
jgi:serine/threonine protein kinase